MLKGEMAHYHERARSGQPAQRCSDCSEAQNDDRRTCAHLRGTALGRGERPSREALTKREQSTRWHQSQPRLYAVRAPVGGTPLPLDTALVTSRVRARRGAKNPFDASAETRRRTA